MMPHMPRLPPSLVRSASLLDKHLPRLIQECGGISSASNEIRWMKEAIIERHHTITRESCNLDQSSIWSKSTLLGKKLEQYVGRRARGEPLQYILGSQPFGELEIKCKSQVLIPRGETEVYTTQVAKILLSIPPADRSGLAIADFCTGTGCIALLLHSLLRPKSDQVQYWGRKLSIHGFDISQHALTLAGDNLRYNVQSQALHSDAISQVSFHHADVLALGSLSMTRISAALPVSHFDVVVSNPPYISPQHFAVGGLTSRSVRKYEPKLALVPPETTVFRGVEQADQFYVALHRIAVATRAKLLIMEVGGTAQALRVMQICMNMEKHMDHGFTTHHKAHVEIWKDDGKIVSADVAEPMLAQKVGQEDSGSEHDPECRAVVVWFDQKWTSHRLQDTV